MNTNSSVWLALKKALLSDFSLIHYGAKNEQYLVMTLTGRPFYPFSES